MILTGRKQSRRERDAAVRDLILNALAEQLPASDICQMTVKKLGVYVDDGYIAKISYTARKKGDPRALTRRGRKGHAHTTIDDKPATSSTEPRKARDTPPPVAGDMFSKIPAPPEARPVPLNECRAISSADPQCRFPLHGDGVALIVCGAPTLPAKSVCAYHARIAYVPAEGRR